MINAETRVLLTLGRDKERGTYSSDRWLQTVLSPTNPPSISVTTIRKYIQFLRDEGFCIIRVVQHGYRLL